MISTLKRCHVLTGVLLAALGFATGEGLRRLSPGLPTHAFWQASLVVPTLWLVSRVGSYLRLPRFFMVIPFCIIITTLCGFYYYPRKDNQVLINRFREDELGSQTRKFVSRFPSSLRLGQFEMTRLPFQVNSHKSSQKLLLAEPHVRALIAGSTKFLEVHFPPRPFVRLQDINVREVSGPVAQLRLIQSVPFIGVPLDKVGAGESFLSDLMRGYPRRDQLGLLEPIQVVDLTSAAERVAFWRTFSHRAYPYLLLGNHYFTEVLQKQQIEGVSRQCAYNAFKEALGLQHFHNNPSLYVAASNNFGVFLVYEGWQRQDKKLIQQGERLIRYAIPQGSRPGMIKLISSDIAKSLRKNSRLLPELSVLGRGE
jgi:hypothetical protein